MEKTSLSKARIAARWISERTKEEEYLLYQSPEKIFTNFQTGNALVAIVNDEVVGHFTLYHLINDWWEMGTAIVKLNLRGQGIGHAFYKALEQQNRDKNILGTTKSKIALELSLMVDFEIWEFNQLPEEVWVATCICEVVKDFHECPNKDNSCILRVRLAKQ